jgi:hypothetical protein
MMTLLIQKRLAATLVCVSVTLGVALCSATVRGHGDTKIEIQALDGQLEVEMLVHTSMFGEPVFGLPPATELPGVDAVGGISTADDVMLEIIGPLLFSQGLDGGSTELTDGVIEVIAPDGVDSILVDAATTTLPALDWLPLGGQLIDIHGTYALIDRGSDLPGAYGLQMRAISPQFAASEPFLVVIGAHDFDPVLLGEAAAQILAASDLVFAPIPGDANGDDVVDGLDYLVWAAHYGDDPAEDPPGPSANGDLNDDEVVDGLDYLVWAAHFGESQAMTVPEPSGLTLLGMALARLAWPRNRRLPLM